MKRVQIQSVIGKTAIDVMGNKLTIAGNLTVHENDFVWSDGRIIYGNLQGNAPAPMTFIRGMPPGIPLNTKYGLLIYTRGHKIYRFGKAKQRGLLNNSKKYSLNSRIGGAKGISDADISHEGKTWEISLTNQGYNETTNIDWLYNGVKFSDYWTPRFYPISVLMSMRDLPQENFEWNIGNRQNTVEQIVVKTTVNNQPAAQISHNGTIVQSIDVKHFADYAKTQLSSLMSGFQNSKFKYTIGNCSARLTSAWIDTKGNWCGIISMTAGGVAYKDYAIAIRLSNVRVVQQQANNIYYFRFGNYDDYQKIHTVEFKGSYQAHWYVENGSLIMPVFESRDVGANEDGGYIDEIDRRFSASNDFFEWVDDAEKFFDGIRVSTKATTLSGQKKLPGEYRMETSECFVPLQEDYTVKYKGASSMVDRTTVYKNGAELFKHSGGVYHVTAVNEKKGEYLFIAGNGVYVVRNGEIKQVFWKGNSIYPNNFRLHYMNNLSDLHRDENKIP